ncbi:hypothetical protein D3C77_463070 [compost metagenome]
MLEQVADTDGIVGTGIAQAEGHDAETGKDHRDDGADLEQRQPEFHLAEHFDVAQVQAANQEDDAQHPDPARHFRKPEAHIDAEGGDVGEADDDHFKGVGPAEDEPRHGAKIRAGVVAEGAGHRVVHGHFPQRAHDHEYRCTTDQVGQQHRWPGHLDGGGGTIEQPGADRRAQCHEANVARGEPALESLSLLHVTSLFLFWS